MNDESLAAAPAGLLAWATWNNTEVSAMVLGGILRRMQGVSAALLALMRPLLIEIFALPDSLLLNRARFLLINSSGKRCAISSHTYCPRTVLSLLSTAWEK